ncbi:MAG: 6,7-dimethyl-8-ribityllumazine synthase [Myxococcales bacterium]|nr:6,7-dimethyl-8-ribityllumazine synthase [Myxococcales bacterium]USN49774.1 MAG: 6,7-dimethyl-8-ribityllumazine synthase [Myxococcales bacterium]
MKNPRILIVWSNYHHALAEEQLEGCLKLLQNSKYTFEIETVRAGCYEIPSVIRTYQKQKPFDAYIALGLLLKGETDHYEFIFQHVKDCFLKFSMDGLLIGNGIISAPNSELLTKRVKSAERTLEAFNAVDYLLDFHNRLLNNL